MTSQAEPPTQHGGGFFNWLRGLGVNRGGDRWLAGVASGLAARAGIDPLIVRGVFIVLAIVGGPALLIYVAGWLLLPAGTGRIHAEDIVRGRADSGVITAAVIAAAVLLLPLLFFGVGQAGIGIGFAFGFGAWDLWDVLGFPDWLSTTLAWLFWIAVIATAGFWARHLLIKRGRDQNAQSAQQPTEPFEQPQPTHGPTAAPAPASGNASAAFVAGPADNADGPSTTSFAAPASATQPDADTADTADTPNAPGWGEAPSADTPGAGSTSDWAQSLTDQANRLGDKAQQLGDKAGQWGQETGQRVDAWSARLAEEHDARKLGSGHVLITLALALLAAGFTAFFTLRAGLEFPAPGATVAYVAAPLVAALIAAVVVLALSMIVAGVRGRTTGFVGFLSFCGVIALLITAVLPWGTRFQPFGEMHVDGRSAPGAVNLAGSVELDLSDLDRANQPPVELDVWQLAGDVEVTLPADAPTVLEVRMLAGRIDESVSEQTRSAGEDRSVSGPFISRTIGINLPSRATTGAPGEANRVTVYVLAGQVDVVHPEQPLLRRFMLEETTR